ncbi:MAG: glycosyltransferase family 4 protein [Euryarchaeota archaeon]|nr:glycosyltransferase family 4 protein [Euryarchaeota archaeon]
MRIVHVAIRYPPATGGGETHVYNLSLHQARLGHDVAVVTTKLVTEVPRKEDSTLPGDETVEGLEVKRLETRGTGLPIWGYGSIMKGLIAAVKEFEPEVVHAHGYGYAHTDLLARWGDRSGVKVVATSHGFVRGRGLFGPLKSLYDMSRGRETASRIALGVGVTQETADGWRRLGARRTAVIPNGVDLEDFDRKDTGKRFKESLGIEGPMILSAGRLQEVKGQDRVIRAFAEADLPAGARLVIAGPDGGFRRTLERLAMDLKVRERVNFTGGLSQNDLLAAYRSADLMVHAPRYESFGIVLVEAMASGLPIITVEVGGIRHVVDDCAVLVDGDPSSLARAMERHFVDVEAALPRIQKGLERAKHFEWKEIAWNSIEEYEKVME